MSGRLRVLTARQAKSLDARAKAAYGVSVLVLMENAGREIAREAVRLYGKKKIAILCGRGNNGGDGFVAARHLLAQGIKPDVYLAGKIADVRNEARVNLNILLKLKQHITQVPPHGVHVLSFKRYGLIIDALLGVGLNTEVSGIYAGLIDLANSSGAKIISVDIPSGLDATTGKIRGQCVRADKTITFVAKKRGMTINDGPRCCGKVAVVDIGLPF
jgi:hydroxyethylthiazole kinase-like uncharacterized protein yjeF